MIKADIQLLAAMAQQLDRMGLVAIANQIDEHIEEVSDGDILSDTAEDIVDEMPKVSDMPKTLNYSKEHSMYKNEEQIPYNLRYHVREATLQSVLNNPEIMAELKVDNYVMFAKGHYSWIRLRFKKDFRHEIALANVEAPGQHERSMGKTKRDVMQSDLATEKDILDTVHLVLRNIEFNNKRLGISGN